MDMNYSLSEIKNAAVQLINIIGNRKCVAFHGEMGAGKTTFINAICSSLGLIKNASSPTFSIINEYKLASTEIIYHIDLYRLKNIDEAKGAGVEDCLYSGDYCFVEWPERAEDLFPENTVHCYITSVDTNQRILKIIL